jgi:hypothetical protein
MKILIINSLFLFCFCFSNKLVCQTFHGLAPGSSWIHEWDNSSWGGETAFEEISIGADTIISAQTYHKVMSNFYNGSINYMGAVRNDTAGKQVLIVPKDSVTDYKLYDYGVNIGDTVFNVYYNTIVSAVDGVLSDFKIVNIDSFMINSVYYNRYTVENLDTPPGAQDYWYEGFGSTDGVLGSGGYEELSSFRWLICCNVNGTTYEHVFFSTPPTISESSSSCILNVVSIEEEGSDINIYPNPSGGELYISVGKKIQSTGLYKLEIYSVDGELVDSFYRESSNDLIKLNIDSLQTGMYFLRFESGDGLVYSHRLIKK